MLSIITVSKDDLAGLGATLRSITTQKFMPAEVIVITKGTSNQISLVDHGITNGTHVVQESVGISAAFNLGIKRAAGTWIQFLNGGDVLADVNALKILTTNITDYANVVSSFAIDEKYGHKIPRTIPRTSTEKLYISHQASIFRKALFDKWGNYSENYKIRMDLEWQVRLLTAMRLVFVDYITVVMKSDGLSTSRPIKTSLEEIRALAEYKNNYRKLTEVALLRLPFRMLRHVYRSSREF
jgi:glycosyltransferase involved in cell wall biosynthesis